MSDRKLYMLDARVLKLHSFKFGFAISHELADLKHSGTFACASTLVFQVYFH